MRAFLLALVVCLGAAVLALAGPPAQQADHKRVQGVWMVQKTEIDGREVKFDSTSVWRFDGERISTETTGKGKQAGAFRLSGGKEIDLNLDTGVDAEIQGKTLRGLYAWDGETLKLALGFPGAERPRDLVSGPEVRVLTLVRSK